MSLTAVGKNFTRMFDQYSVICVFGSVVGCVVMPWITQSIESLIFSAIVISLTAKTLQSRMLAANRDPPIQEDRRKNKDAPHDKKPRRNTKKIVPVQPIVNLELVRRHREEDLKKQEEHRKAEKERRMEEKRDKKARKKEERIKRKEEEKREREKEEQLRRERQETRVLRKQQEREMKERDRVSPFQCPTVENIESIIRHQKPIRRERKNSSSSSTSSSSSAHSPTIPSQHPISQRNRRQHTTVRGIGDPHSAPPTPPPRLDSPQPLHSQPRAWKSLPRVVADLPTLQQVGPYCHPTRGQSVTHHYVPSQVHWSSPEHVLPRQEPAVYPTVHQVKSNKHWVPVYPSYAAQHGYSAAGSVISGDVNNSFGSDRCYSLFSEQQSPFGVSLLPSPRPPEGRSSAAVMATSTEPSSKFDEWPTF